MNSARRRVWQLVAVVVSGEAQDVGAGDGFTGLVIDDEAFNAAKSIFEFRDPEVVSGAQDESEFGDPQFAGSELVVLWGELAVQAIEEEIVTGLEVQRR